MKSLIAVVVALSLVVSGCPKKAELTPEQAAEKKMLSNCFPALLIKEIKKGNLELIPDSGEEILNPFTGEMFTCSSVRTTEKGRQAMLEVMTREE